MYLGLVPYPNEMLLIFSGVEKREMGGGEGWYETTQIVPNDGVSSPLTLSVATHTHTHTHWLYIGKSTMLRVKLIHKIVAKM